MKAVLIAIGAGLFVVLALRWLVIAVEEWLDDEAGDGDF